MDEPIKFGYEKGAPRAGHSRFGIASVAVAVVLYLFIVAAAPPFCISPFQSMGNEKETKVAMIGGIVGVLLSIRAMRNARHKRVLAIVGLVLNGLAIPAAWVFLPYV